MIRPGFAGFVLLPLLGCGAYLLAMQFAPADFYGYVFSENGIVELGTAFFYALAGSIAFALCLKTRGLIPQRYRLYFFAFGVAAWFVSLEEISYGQHFLGLKSFNWFTVNNAKAELNLHNLYGNALSSVLRMAANLVYPISCVALPVWMLSRPRSYQPGQWSFFMLPRRELFATVLVAQSITAVDKLARAITGESCLVRPGEVQELFWSLSSAMYILILWQRIRSPSASVRVSLPDATSPTDHTRAKAA